MQNQKISLTPSQVDVDTKQVILQPGNERLAHTPIAVHKVDLPDMPIAVHKVDLTEKKTDLSLNNECKQITCEELFAQANPELVFNNFKDSVFRGMKEIFTTEIASQHFTAYSLGKERITVYGNPIIMGVLSERWREIQDMTLLGCEVKRDDVEVKHGGAKMEFLQVASHLIISEFPSQFITLWCYINGMLSDAFEIEGASFLEVIKALELSHYFQVTSSVEIEAYNAFERLISSWMWIDSERVEYINQLLNWGIKLQNADFKQLAIKALILPFSFEKAVVKKS